MSSYTTGISIIAKGKSVCCAEKKFRIAFKYAMDFFWGGKNSDSAKFLERNCL